MEIQETVVTQDIHGLVKAFFQNISIQNLFRVAMEHAMDKPSGLQGRHSKGKALRFAAKRQNARARR